MATRHTALLLAILLAAAFIHPAQAQLFSDGFESNDFTAWSDGVTEGTGDSCTVVTTDPKYGTYHARMYTDASSTHNAYVTHDLGSSYQTSYVRFFVQFNTGLTSWKKLAMFDNSGGGNVWFLVNNGNNWRLWYYDGASQTYDNQAYSTSTNTWYCVEIYSYIDGTAGAHTVWVDETEVISVSSLDNDAAGNPQILDIGQQGEGSITNYFDAVVVDTSYIGPGEGGQDLTFINTSSLRLHDTATTGLDLARTYGDVLALYAADTMNKEAGFQTTGTLALWAAAAIGREWGFTLSGLLHLWESHSMTTELAAGVERFFTLLATLRLHAAALPTFEVRTPVQHAFNLYAAIHLHDSEAIAKELGYLATGTIRLWDSMAKTTEGVAQELTFILSETIHLIASVAATMDTAALVLDAASIAGLALIIALVAVALIMVRRRND